MIVRRTCAMSNAHILRNQFAELRLWSRVNKNSRTFSEIFVLREYSSFSLAFVVHIARLHIQNGGQRRTQ